MNELVPEKWKMQPLSALADYHNGRAFKPEDWSKKGLPILRIAQINNPSQETDYYSGLDILDKHLIRKGDLIFSWSATLKAILWKEYDAVLNQHIFKVIEKQDTSRIFLQQLLEYSIEKLAESSHGSTMKHIKKGVLDEFHCPIPPLPEQKKIASILTSVDEVIEKTQLQINKLQDLKKGTMNELLTKGIGHTEFKDSELGQIPKSWKITKISDVRDKSDRYSFTGGPFGSNLKREDYTKNGIRIIQLQNIGDGKFLNKYKIYTSNTKADELKSCNIYPGDIILSKMGDLVARATSIPDFDTRYLMASDGIRLSINKKEYDTTFILESINNYTFRNQADLSSTGSTRKRIGLVELRELKIVIPPLSEQKKITSIITS